MCSLVVDCGNQWTDGSDKLVSSIEDKLSICHSATSKKLSLSVICYANYELIMVRVFWTFYFTCCGIVGSGHCRCCGVAE